MNILFDDHVTTLDEHGCTCARVTAHSNGSIVLFSVARTSAASDTTFSMNLISISEIEMLERALAVAKRTFTNVD